ncbi:MAG TPA: DNA-protecting protein DprA, partial [Bacteroidetes bacterium]|nr:DNA-protecting protein DprA [Bacteroidota bacterium]
PQSIASFKSFNDWDKVDRIIKRTQLIGAKMITPEDLEYPDRLKEITSPPLLLWYKGDVNLLKSAGIAVVGTRYPSSYGKDMAREFTRSLVANNVTIISGLAYGIDTIAHQACLNENGKTIAVLGSGIDVIYPISNTYIADEILEKKGLILSEFPPGTKPDYQNFPTRNRIVSGLSLGVLVVETKNEGGSMITANLAFDQNREVFVIPHNLTNKKGDGCQNLIRGNTGKLVENVEDILTEFPWLDFKEESKSLLKHDLIDEKIDQLEDDNKLVCMFIQRNKITHFDEILLDAGIAHSRLTSILLELEFSELIKQLPGKRYQMNFIQ